MYLPSCENRTSEMEEMISEKKERAEGSSSCSNSKVQLDKKQKLSPKLAYAWRADHREHSRAYLLI